MSLIIMAHHLISATDSEKSPAVFDSRYQTLIFAVSQIPEQNFLFEILTASDKENVILREVCLLADAEKIDVAAYSAPFKPLPHADNVAAVTI